LTRLPGIALSGPPGAFAWRDRAPYADHPPRPWPICPPAVP